MTAHHDSTGSPAPGPPDTGPRGTGPRGTGPRGTGPRGTDTGITVGAQFYDVRQRAICQTRAQAVVTALDERGRRPRRGVLDLGAGTGVATVTLAQAWPEVPVHAIEPSVPMRIALLTNLAHDPALVERVTVHPHEVTDLERPGIVDVATAFWSLFMVFPDVLDQTIVALRDTLTDDGLLVTETAPGLPRPGVQRWEETFTIGEHRVEHEGRVEVTPDGAQHKVFTYRWRDAAGRLVHEGTDAYAVDTAPDLAAAVARCGLVPVFSFADPAGGTFTAYGR